MTGLAITLLVLRTLLVAAIGILPAFEVARATRDTMVSYVYPIRTKRNIITVLTISVLAGLFVAMYFTVPIANFLFLLFTGS